MQSTKSPTHSSANPSFLISFNLLLRLGLISEVVWLIDRPFLAMGALGEKAQIEVEGADHLYREIHIENTLTDGSGREVKMKEGAHVDVTIEADPAETTPKNPTDR